MIEAILWYEFNSVFLVPMLALPHLRIIIINLIILICPEL